MTSWSSCRRNFSPHWISEDESSSILVFCAGAILVREGGWYECVCVCVCVGGGGGCWLGALSSWQAFEAPACSLLTKLWQQECCPWKSIINIGGSPQLFLALSVCLGMLFWSPVSLSVQMAILPRFNAPAETRQDTECKSAGVMTGHGAIACCWWSVYWSSCAVFHCDCLALSACPEP